MGNKFNWVITGKKVAVQAVIVIIAGVAASYGDSTWYLAIAPLANGILNWLKHRKD